MGRRKAVGTRTGTICQTKEGQKYHLLENIFCNEKFEKEIDNVIEENQVAVYGMTAVGKALASRLRERYEIPFLMDRSMHGEKYAGIPIFAVNHLKDLDKKR